MELPSAPGRLPLFGHMPSYLRDPFGFLSRARDTGDMVTIDFPLFQPVLLHDPLLVEKVMVTDHRNYTKDSFGRDLVRVLGHGLLTSEGDFWLRQRRLAQPAFHKERIASYAATMVESSKRMIEGFRSGEARDIHADLMRLTLEIVGKTLFGTDVGAEARMVDEAMQAVMDRYSDIVALSVPHWDKLPTPLNRRFNEAIRSLDVMVRGLVRSHVAGKTGDGKDLLSMLLAARDEEGRGMNETQLRDEAITLILAGHETTAISLSWTLVLLSQNPGARAKLEAEIDSVLGDRAPTMADLAKLPYADAVVRESMRLYPPAWSLGREAVTEVEVGGRRFPKGTNFWMVPWTMHRDRRFYERPNAFEPERWASGLAKKIPKYAYFPFGGGPRLCIGHSFATMEAILVLVTLARSFRADLVSGHSLQVQPAITLRPKSGVRVRLSARAHERRAVELTE
ncbi:MAG: cytochrome P450 [Polyangiales bacterium]